MSDQQPWRRRMLPPLSRPRTPLLQTASFEDLKALNRAQVKFDYYSDRSGPALLAPEPLHPSKRHSRSKFLARASQYFGATASSGKDHSTRHDCFSVSFDPEPPKDLDHAHVNQIIDTVFSRIVANLGKPISALNNEPVLRVFEAYRDLKEEKESLQKKLNEAVAHCNTTLDTLEGERRRWKEDETNYKAEVKRLELIIAHGKTGLSAVTIARQQSLIRRVKPKRFTETRLEHGDTKETNYSFMDTHLGMERGESPGFFEFASKTKS
jgi:hypothetical protein